MQKVHASERDPLHPRTSQFPYRIVIYLRLGESHLCVGAEQKGSDRMERDREGGGREKERECGVQREGEARNGDNSTHDRSPSSSARTPPSHEAEKTTPLLWRILSDSRTIRVLRTLPVTIFLSLWSFLSGLSDAIPFPSPLLFWYFAVCYMPLDALGLAVIVGQIIVIGTVIGAALAVRL